MAWWGCCMRNKRRPAGRKRSQSPLAEKELDDVRKDDVSHNIKSSVHAPDIVVDRAEDAEIKGTNVLVHANPMSTLSPLSVSPLSSRKPQSIHHNSSQPSHPRPWHRVSDSSSSSISIVNEAFMGDDPPASSLHAHPVSENSSYSGNSPLLLEAHSILCNPSFSDSDDPPDQLFDPDFCHPMSQRSSIASVGSGKESIHTSARWQSEPSIEGEQKFSHRSSQPAPFDVV